MNKSVDFASVLLQFYRPFSKGCNAKGQSNCTCMQEMSESISKHLIYHARHIYFMSLFAESFLLRFMLLLQ